ncbi:hypothetical protein [Synechococcus sp. LA31]|uniref:hypothetical protein n=1 Tax=Synechococcus sp. LA31 TaxID=2741953 RepID=UPI001BDDA1BA|nr:hypothetical protein [Synechococcus sp. LA31]QVV66777.1 hypothetical protein KJJ24_09800 [Synechococcus sp. LA31]
MVVLMDGIAYREQIRRNLEEVRQLLWGTCCNGHADAALTASREALSSARAIAALCHHKPGNCGPDDVIRPLPIRPGEPRRRPARKGGRR